MKSARFAAALALGTALCAIAVPSKAATINLIDTGGVTGSPAELGFKIAAAYWGKVLVNNAVINLEVGFENMGSPNVLGSTGSNVLSYVPISSYYGLLNSTGTSALDNIAVSNLSPLVGGGVSAIVPDYEVGTLGIDPYNTRNIDASNGAISTDIALLTANAKALGLNLGNIVDASITFNSIFSWDYDPTDGVGAGTYDFIGVAVHEIGHALGFVSGVDDFDYSVGGLFPTDDYWWGYGLDLFRYSANGQLDWSIGTESYFSIDGGLTNEGNFSTGSNYGDGWQASHWKANGTCNNFIGIMNPYACNGTVDEVTAADLMLFDAIGWNLDFDILSDRGYVFTSADMYRDYFAAAVPEPATWAMLISGFGMVGLMSRRRRSLGQAQS